MRSRRATRSRTAGGANVQAAAERAGARRYIAQSGCYYYVPGAGLATEETSFAVDAPPLIAGGAQALLGIEKRVLGGPVLGGYRPPLWVLLRPGYLVRSGRQCRRAGAPSAVQYHGWRRRVWSFVHIADAAAATLAALTRGARGAYNVTDDEPSPLAVWLPGYARWLGAPAPAQISADEVENPDARFYAMQLRGASNARLKHELGLRPRRREWLGATM